MNLKSKLSLGAASAMLMASALTPVAFANTTVVEAGNGAFSYNSVKVKSSNTTSVGQSNSSVISNTVSTSSSTGGNDASFNTGGDVKIVTGNASTNVGIMNTGSSNEATLPDCGCNQPDTTVLIKKNGAFSVNKVKVNYSNTKVVSQSNTTVLTNLVGSSSSTGDNNSSFNTDGGTIVKTGSTWTKIKVYNTGSSNTLN